MAGTLSKLRKAFSLRRSSSSSSSSSSRRHRQCSSPPVPTAVVSSTNNSDVPSGDAGTSPPDSASSDNEMCPICLGEMLPGGRGLFTAECAHTFHHFCICSAFHHGYPFCPVCRRRMAIEPITSPPAVILPPEPEHFDDDHPLLPPPSPPTSAPPPSALAYVRTVPEHPALPASDSRPEFAVLVNLRAPTLAPPSAATWQPRAPVDLVTVLDVSGSMDGLKLALLKRAVAFVADQLSPADRLSVVAFTTTARRVLPLSRMTPEGRDLAIRAVESLDANGGTDIMGGLQKGVRVLEERRERNPVSSIILLSDGQDYYTSSYLQYPGCRPAMQWLDLKYIDILPLSVKCRLNGETSPGRAVPIHAFGIGTDHDAVIMHAISDASGGTFSYIEEEGYIQDAFAQCIGGLLTVVAQDVQLSLKTAFPGVSIERIAAGNHSTGVYESHGTISVGDLYADEVKDFLVHTSVPAYQRRSGGSATMPLFKVRCTYKDPITREAMKAEKKTAEIARPEAVAEEDLVVNVEVDRQWKRINVAEGIAEARGLADKGDLDGAQEVLTERMESLLASQLLQGGDELCKGLEAELEEVRSRMASKEAYEAAGGRAYVLSGMSSQLWQRATTRGSGQLSRECGASGGDSRSMSTGFETPSMTEMVRRSQILSPAPLAARQRSVSEEEELLRRRVHALSFGS